MVYAEGAQVGENIRPTTTARDDVIDGEAETRDAAGNAAAIVITLQRLRTKRSPFGAAIVGICWHVPETETPAS